MTVALDIIQCDRNDWENSRCAWIGPRSEAEHYRDLILCPNCDWVIEWSESDVN